MGDEGRLYVSEEIVPAYKSLLRDADLILPNAFEAELLSGIKIESRKSLVTAITELHKVYQLPHIIITSVRIALAGEKHNSSSSSSDDLVVCGSSCKSGQHRTLLNSRSLTLLTSLIQTIRLVSFLSTSLPYRSSSLEQATCSLR